MSALAVKDIRQVCEQPGTLLVIKQSASAVEAARKMSDNQVGSLVVFDEKDRFVGVLTERDMLAKVLAGSLVPDKALVRDIMTKDVISCSMDTDIEKVERLMSEHKIRHVPIVEKGIPVGMISSRDIIAHRLSSNKQMRGAAEQMAMLSTGLKSLDFDDVIELAINEVPKSFEAQCAVLCFAQKDTSSPIIYQKGCPLSQELLLKRSKIKQASENEQVIDEQICGECKAAGGSAPRLSIPLIIWERPDERSETNVSRKGFLCMCRLNPSVLASRELQMYKASLLRELLSVNLTNAKLYLDYQKARRDSEIDHLTGVGTRRMLEQSLERECARAARYERSLSVAIADIDNFKQINDRAGHTAGDKALQQVAKTILQNMRTTDTVIARYGGDEFVLLMPETKLSGARMLLERLRQQVEGISIRHVGSISISAGVAEWRGCSQDTPQLLLERADAALYHAKRSGRNQVVASQPSP